VPAPLTGVSSGFGDGEATILVNVGGCSKGYRVAADFEGVSSEVRDGDVVVSGKAEVRSGAG